MSLIARHIENPDKIFFYRILNKTSDELLLKILRNKENLIENEFYELIVTDSRGYRYILGKISEKNNDLVKIKIIKENIKKRKFFRIYLKKNIIPVGIVPFKGNHSKPIVGILKDFSLGGFRISLSKKDFILFEEIIKKLHFDQKLVKAIFRLPFDKDKVSLKTIELDASIIRIDPSTLSVAFSFTFNSKNDKVLNLFKILLKEEKR